MAIARARASAGMDHGEEPASAQARRRSVLSHELANADRNSSLAELAASIAHEVNNPLTAILVSAEAASRWLADPRRDVESARASIARVAQEADRARSIVEGLKRLAQGGALIACRVELGPMLDEVVTAMKPEIVAAEVTLSLDAPDKSAAVWGDRVQLQQILLNLIRNGIEAIAKAPLSDRRSVVWAWA